MGLVQDIQKAAAGHGHGCTCDDCLREHNGRGPYGFDTVMAWRLAAAAVLLVAALAVGKPFPVLSTALSVLSILVAGYDVFIRAAANGIRRKVFDESLLMSVVAIAAVIIGHGPEGAFYMLLLQLGELIRGYAVEKAHRSIESVADLPPSGADGALGGIFSGGGGKNRLEEFIAHFARFYTPIILGIAILIAVLAPVVLHKTVAESVYRALVLMVIACPCAIVVSVPLAYLAGIGGAARQGLIFKNTAALEAVSRVGAVVFDKSGALEGEGLRVVSVKSDRMDADVLLRIAAHACAYADGVYADSIKAAYQDAIYIELIQSFRQEAGRGITVEVDGVRIILGSQAFVEEHGVDPSYDATEELSAYVAIDGQYAGRILFGSVVKPEVPGTVTALDWERGRLVAMVTEDLVPAAEKFARSAGIGRYYAGCTPEGKASVVRDLKDRQPKRACTVFVGDPERDPACFREADIGAATGGDTARALELADIAVSGRSPAGIFTAMEAAKYTRAIAWQNILCVLAFKIIILVLDMLGVCPLWLAVLADVGAALAAVLNCLRALVLKEPELPVK